MMSELKDNTINVVVIKIIFLLVFSFGCFLTDNILVLIGLFLFVFFLWFLPPLSPKELLKKIRRILFFIVFLFLSYIIMPGEAIGDYYRVELFKLSYKVYESSLVLGTIMSLRILTIVIASMYIRASSSPAQFIKGLNRVGIPHSIAISIDIILGLLGGTKTKRKKDLPVKNITSLKKLSKEKNVLISFVENTIEEADRYIKDQGADYRETSTKDLAIITGLCVLSMSIKFMKIMPGVPVGPGHKNLIIIPMYFLSSELTSSRWGGTWFGTSLGIIAFLFGEGRFGIFEIIKYVVTGLFFDIIRPIFNRFLNPPKLWAIIMISFLGSLTRLATIIIVAIILKAPPIFFAFLTPMAISHLVFGTSSSPISYIFLKHFKNRE